MIKLPESLPSLALPDGSFYYPEDYLTLVYYDCPRLWLSWVENIPTLVIEKDESNIEKNVYVYELWVIPLNEELLCDIFLRKEPVIKIMKQVQTEVWIQRVNIKERCESVFKRRLADLKDFSSSSCPNESYVIHNLTNLEEILVFLNKNQQPGISKGNRERFYRKGI